MSESYLSRLYYASSATDTYTPMELGGILESCRHNNPPLDVTGVLFLGNGYFFQCLEGPRKNVNQIYNHILEDPRHTEVELLEFKEVGDRLFEEWSMKYVRCSTVVDKILRQTGVRSFNPHELDSYTVNILAEAFSSQSNSENTAATEEHGSIKKKKHHLFGFFR
ncbi:BLUF domain-containing protein [Candidatus Albibeggiatoa sp. nov. NOAA]|uniref:BLUF domain-containing protein n=1 Tax=Candidatus Albibeggiatoa sp. nov. NOAA TaxID=3162724 RepID=UPI003303F57D|nr:BLUF domain-containing protein [Thiotrichaceae bacterium]